MTLRCSKLEKLNLETTGKVNFCEQKTYTHESVLIASSVVRVPTHFRRDHPLLCLALKENKNTRFLG